MEKTQHHAHMHDNHRHHKKQQAMLTIGFISLSLLLMGVVVAIIFVIQSDKQQAKVALNNAVSVKTTEQGKKAITSQLGFELSYDSDFFDANGQVTTSVKDGIIGGEGYENDELSSPRSYSIVKVKPKQSAAYSADLGFVSPPELAILTTARQQYFESRRPNYPGLNDTEITVREFAPPTGQLKTRGQETIGGISYQKILYEFRSTSGTIIAYELQYVTVQTNRPYKATLHYFPSTKEGDLTPLLQVIRTLKFAAPSTEAQYLTKNSDSAEPKSTAALASTQIKLTADTINTPQPLKEGTDLTIVAKNQLAVVRVGTIYCFDFSLTGAKAPADFSNICSAASGSGAIMRSDGMVSTNGHVAVLSIKSAISTQMILDVRNNKYTLVQQFADYFVANGQLLQTEATKFIEDIKARDSKSYETMLSLLDEIPKDRFKIKKETGEYAIQLSNEPLQLNLDEKLSFEYSKTVLKAKFIDSNFNRDEALDLATVRASDVALLDIEENRKFPVIPIGSLNSLKTGGQLTIMGFPGFVDGGLTTTKRRTIPTATQGEVMLIDTDEGGHKLVKTDAPLAEGNSGGPVFDKNGKQIGLATYAVLSASDPEIGKTKFSEYSVIRDVADFTAVAAKNKISFDGKSSVNDNWYPAIDALGKGDYGAAADQLKKVRSEYGEHYLISSLIKDAEIHAGSFTGIIRLALYIALPILALALVVWIILFIRHRAHAKLLYPNYPTAPNAPPPIFQPPVMN